MTEKFVNLENLTRYDEKIKAYIGDKATALTVDSALSDTSTNPVENKAVNAAIKEVKETIEDVKAMLLAYLENTTPDPDVANTYIAQVVVYDADGNSTQYPVGSTQMPTITVPSGGSKRVDRVPIVWDGTVDTSWFSSEQTEFTLSYPAQLAGLAAIVNGGFEAFPTEEVEDSNYGTVLRPSVDSFTETVGSDYKGTFTYSYGLYDVADNIESGGDISSAPYVEGLSRTTTFIGDPKSITCDFNQREDDGSTLLELHDWSYYSGLSSFEGKTVYLDNDMDFGATETSTGQWDLTSPNWLPIGGNSTYNINQWGSHYSTGFLGTFDGQGHVLSNLFCNRLGRDVSFGENSAVALFGAIGQSQYEEDSKMPYRSVVRDVRLNSGLIVGGRSVGGIVGKTNETQADLGLTCLCNTNLTAFDADSLETFANYDNNNGTFVIDCVNQATVLGTEAKGMGGIVGAAFYTSHVINCSNYGKIISLRLSPCGGIAGLGEHVVAGCTSAGSVSAGSSSRAVDVVTNNGGMTSSSNVKYDVSAMCASNTVNTGSSNYAYYNHGQGVDTLS